MTMVMNAIEMHERLIQIGWADRDPSLKWAFLVNCELRNGFNVKVLFVNKINLTQDNTLGRVHVTSYWCPPETVVHRPGNIPAGEELASHKLKVKSYMYACFTI